MKISVIIPTLNEAANVGPLINYLYKYGSEKLHEIIVVDGGSTDNTKEKSISAGANTIEIDKKSRAIQMNYGAKKASGDIFYFVHADALPPKDYAQNICNAVLNGCGVGCFRFKFDSPKRLLKINSYITRFKGPLSGGGDQTLFIQRQLFDQMKGFNENYMIMEDFEFARRIKKKCALTILPGEVTVSARKYETNSYLKVNASNILMFTLFSFGVSPNKLSKIYKRLLTPVSANRR
ncbi:MAG: TIGR04283 family arsenosugar biosynthesis glycosyltransferase [Bacteroidetes bacterium]|nr:TIGR04283 family arsenosugar biosynthesis glycosyltransferase [Bacteroidota bacterium]